MPVLLTDALDNPDWKISVQVTKRIINSDGYTQLSYATFRKVSDTGRRSYVPCICKHNPLPILVEYGRLVSGYVTGCKTCHIERMQNARDAALAQEEPGQF